jgi:transmembrane sensor
MTTNLVAFPDTRRAREQAALWLTRLDRGLATEERSELRQWLADITNHKALVEMARLWRGMDAMAVLAELFPLSTSRLNRPPARSFHSMALSAAAAASIVALLTLFMLGQAPWNLFGAPKAAPMAVPNEVFSTSVRETRVIHPGDGSTITMNTSSAMVVIYSPRARYVYLLRGEASFEIERDLSRPFHLHAGKRVLEASASNFNVRMVSPHRVELTVSDGRVKVVPAADTLYIPKSPREAPLIARRESLVYEQEIAIVEPHEETVRRLEPAELDARLAWQRGMLVFQGEPLEQVLSQTGRYTATEFILADEALHRVHISGSFRTGDVDGLLIGLRMNHGIDSRREGSNRVILTAAPAR